LILIVFGASVGLPSEIPGWEGAAISSGILDVSFFVATIVFASGDFTACTSAGFGVRIGPLSVVGTGGFMPGFSNDGSGAVADTGLASGTVILIVSVLTGVVADLVGCSADCATGGVVLGTA
jgi:hypothetical protein